MYTMQKTMGILNGVYEMHHFSISINELNYNFFYLKLSLHQLERFKKTIVCSGTEHSEDCEISGASGLGQEHRTKDGGGRGPGGGGKTGGDVSVGMMGE